MEREIAVEEIAPVKLQVSRAGYGVAVRGGR